VKALALIHKGVNDSSHGNQFMESTLMKKISIQLLASFVVLAGLAAHAQRPHQPPDPAQMVQHRVDFLTSKLGLTPAQQQQASTIFANEMSSAKSQHEQMKTANQNLEAAVKNNDSAGIEQAAQTIGNLTSQSIAAHAKAEAAFLQTLNPEQQTQYSQMPHPGMRKFGEHRPF
jgi:Spy/CpxP family protein refolding chaperone